MNPVESKTVRHLSALNFEGNIIPHHWYDQLKTEAGHTDLNAIIILAEIVFLHRPITILDRKGKPLLRQRFKGQTLNLQVAYFVDKFGLSDNQARDALKRLENKHGLINREYKTALEEGKRVSNVMFISLNTKKLKAITHPDAADIDAEDDTPPTPSTPQRNPNRAGGLKAALNKASAKLNTNPSEITEAEFERRRQAQLQQLRERQQQTQRVAQRE